MFPLLKARADYHSKHKRFFGLKPALHSIKLQVHKGKFLSRLNFLTCRVCLSYLSPKKKKKTYKLENKKKSIRYCYYFVSLQNYIIFLTGSSVWLKNIYGPEYKSHIKLWGRGPENYLQKSTLRLSGKNRSNFPCVISFFSFIINILVTLMFVFH